MSSGAITGLIISSSTLAFDAVAFDRRSEKVMTAPPSGVLFAQTGVPKIVLGSRHLLVLIIHANITSRDIGH